MQCYLARGHGSFISKNSKKIDPSLNVIVSNEHTISSRLSANFLRQRVSTTIGLIPVFRQPAANFAYTYSLLPSGVVLIAIDRHQKDGSDKTRLNT